MNITPTSAPRPARSATGVTAPFAQDDFSAFLAARTAGSNYSILADVIRDGSLQARTVTPESASHAQDTADSLREAAKEFRLLGTAPASRMGAVFAKDATTVAKLSAAMYEAAGDQYAAHRDWTATIAPVYQHVLDGLRLLGN